VQDLTGGNKPLVDSISQILLYICLLRSVEYGYKKLNDKHNYYGETVVLILNILNTLSSIL
jgi:hypothetical protein